MKRRKNSTNMTTVVHAGWMTKSPPEQKLNTPFKIFRSQWKRRYFVLRKPSGSLPDQYELHYYKDERCSARKGAIDLEQCEQIVAGLDSDEFPYLLAIKTFYKNKERTYYLAAESEQEMNTWVQWLCHVCGLKPEDPPSDIPEPKPMTQTPASQGLDYGGAGAATAGGGGASNGQVASSLRAPSQALSSSPVVTTQAAVSPSVRSQPPHHPVHSIAAGRLSDSSLSPYIPLEDCHTGEPPVRRESVESVPDFQAPSPPLKQKSTKAAVSVPTASDDDVFVVGGGGGKAGADEDEDHDLYDRPPPSSGSRKVNLLSTVPVAPKMSGNKSDDDKQSYDVPPSALYRNQSPRRHSGRPDSQASSDESGAGGPSECYDYPPKRLDSTTSSDNELVGPPPPARPLKPYHLSQYQNLPSRKSEAGRLGHGSSLRGHPTPPKNSDPVDLMNMVVAPPKPHSIVPGSGYDVPRSSSHRPVRGVGQRSHIMSSTVVPPPPVPKRPSESGANAPLYLNTPDFRESTSDSAVTENGTAGAWDADSADGSLNLVPPAIPPPRHGSSGESQDSRSDRDSPQLLHQSPQPPPVPPSVSSAISVVPPARPPGRAPAPSISPRSQDGAASDSRDEGGVIFSTQRTRSFKRHHQINHGGSPKMSHKSKSQTLPMAVHVPAPRPVVPARPHDTSTSDDDDDAMRLRLRIPDQEEETHHSLSLLHSVPPAVNDDKQLKYIDLALPEASQEHHTPTPRSAHHAHSHSHAGLAHPQVDRANKDQATEYREIDFVKTQALNNAKREKEKERQSDDLN